MTLEWKEKGFNAVTKRLPVAENFSTRAIPVCIGGFDAAV
jgi:hypothetical protein